MTDTASPLVDSESQEHRSFLFTACFVALVATSFAFIIRVMMMDDWQIAFGLSETQKGEILGAGLWLLIMAGCYGLILHFGAKGGKAINLMTEGQAGEHAVTPAEVVADAEETPSE